MITYHELKTAKIVNDIAEKINRMFRDAAHPVPVHYHQFLTEFLQNDPERIATAIIERVPKDNSRNYHRTGSSANHIETGGINVSSSLPTDNPRQVVPQ